MEVSTKPLASEIYDDLKKSIKFRDRLIYVLISVITILIIWRLYNI